MQTLCPDSGHHLQRIPQSQLSPPRTERLLRRTILLADDDRHFRLALRKRLEGQGFHVMESADGFRALIKAQMDSIDVFILDHEMPGGEGREVAEVIRKQSSAPIIFLSGYSKETFRDTVFRLADTYYLPKPLNFDHLTQLLTDCLGSTSE